MMNRDEHNLTSTIAGHGIGFPCGAITLYAGLSPTLIDAPLKSFFAVASLVIGGACVYAGTTQRQNKGDDNFSAPDATTGILGGIALGAFMMGSVHVAEEFARPSYQNVLEAAREYKDPAVPAQKSDVCVMPLYSAKPAAPGCAP